MLYTELDTYELDQEIDIVVAGMDYDYTFSKLALASLYINERKCKLVATNEDSFVYINGRRFPCAGALLAPLILAVQDKSVIEVVGKPNPYAYQMMNEKFNLGQKKVLMVGDNPNTDIAFGNASKIDSCLVMTGNVKDLADFEANWAIGPQT